MGSWLLKISHHFTTTLLVYYYVTTTLLWYIGSESHEKLTFENLMLHITNTCVTHITYTVLPWYIWKSSSYILHIHLIYIEVIILQITYTFGTLEYDTYSSHHPTYYIHTSHHICYTIYITCTFGNTFRTTYRIPFSYYTEKYSPVVALKRVYVVCVCVCMCVYTCVCIHPFHIT